MQRFLISYDITNNKIRSKVFRLLKRNAIPLQKSVFFYEGNNNELIKIEKRIYDMIKDNDNLFVMPCCEKCYANSRIYRKASPVAIAV